MVDGGSTDETVAECERARERFDWGDYDILTNPAKVVPAALNKGLAIARAPWYTRVDGRIWLDENYFEECIRAASSLGLTGGGGGRFVVSAEPTAVAAAIAAAVSHPLGVGGGFRSARPTQLETVAHHPFAVWPRAFVERLGGFREDLARNQDDEFSARAFAAGGRIGLTPATSVYYQPRARYRGLATQYFQYGLWKGAVARTYGVFPARSLLPSATVLGGTLATATAVRRHSLAPIAPLAAAYAVAGRVASRNEKANPLLTAGALALIHATYGTGVALGIAAPRLTKTRMARARII